VIGVAEYIAPEQVNNTSRLDGRADLYSLGAILYEAISGRKVFESKNYFELMSAHKNLRPRPPGLFRPDLPNELEEFMLQALQKDPSQRFQTADAFRAALLAVTAIGVA
jgi:serine/threonine-protein kinase